MSTIAPRSWSVRAFLLLTGLSLPLPAESPTPTAVLKAVRSIQRASSVRVTLQLYGIARHKLGVLRDPDRFYVDLMDTKADPTSISREVSGGDLVRQIRIGLTSTSAARVVFDLSAPMNYFEAPGEQDGELAITLDLPSLTRLQTPLAGWNATARMIAGLELPGSAKMTAEQHDAWAHYAQSMDRGWSRLNGRYLGKIQTWAHQNLKDWGRAEVAFYPFSGPDAAALFSFYPDAREYVMVGLEPIGSVPETMTGLPPEYWSNVRRTLRSVVQLGFFITDEMRDDFNKGGVDGVMPLLLLFAARSGFVVQDVAEVRIGSPPPDRLAKAAPANGIAIFLADEQHRSRRLTYLRLNLSDSLTRKPASLQYLRDLQNIKTLVKSASYLLHKPHFSAIRQVILSQSDVVVEDDSGIPFRFFAGHDWDVNLYGGYRQPIVRFTDWYQEDLKTAFAARGNVQPLAFGIGYQWRPETSNLIVARRKPTPAWRDQRSR